MIKQKKKPKNCFIVYVNDPMGVMGMSPEEEFEQFKDNLNLFWSSDGIPDDIKNRLKFKNENFISGCSFDILVLDYGGALQSGMGGSAGMAVQEFANLLKDNPSRDCILIGSGLEYSLRSEIQHIMGLELKEVPNLHIATAGRNSMGKVVKVIKDWFKYN